MHVNINGIYNTVPKCTAQLAKNTERHDGNPVDNRGL